MLRDPKTLRDTDTIIEDPALEPFFIATSKVGGYTIYEKVTKGKDSKEYLRTVCYPSTFNYALKQIAKEKLHAGEGEVFTSIKQYVDRWEQITKSIETATLMSV